MKVQDRELKRNAPNELFRMRKKVEEMAVQKKTHSCRREIPVK